MFKNLRVKTQLALGFGVAVLLGVAISVIAALQMRMLTTQLDEIANDRMVKVQKFSELKDNLNAIARYARNVLLSDDPAFESSEKKKIEEMRARNSQLLGDLEKIVVLPKGRELLKVIQDTRSSYNARVNDALALDEKGNSQAAVKLLLSEVLSLQNTLFKAVDDSTGLQQSLASSLASNAKDNSALATQILFALAAVMAGLGVAVTWLLVRNLSRALGAEPAELSTAAKRVASGDLSPVPGAEKAPVGSVLSSLSDMQINLASIVGQVRASSQSIATGSAQIATGNQDLSQRTEEQASNLEQTAASMEELTGTVQSSTENAALAKKLAAEASAAAVKGGEVVNSVVATMQDISESSKKIGDIIGVIDSIAFQTNILALNAAVEAARAGEQGRGFAVVASEVRSLAGRSANAAKEIKMLIGASVEKVEAGSHQVDEAGTSMTSIVAQVQRVSDLIGEIASASAEQSTGISQIGDAVNQLDQVTQQNAALVEESAAAAESLKQQAATLAEVVSVFKVSEHAGSFESQALTRGRSSAILGKNSPRTEFGAKQLAKNSIVRQNGVSASKSRLTTAGAASDDWESF